MGVVLTESDNTVLNSSSESLEKNKKQKEYMAYIQDHVNNVMLMYKEKFIPLIGIDITPKNFSEEELKNAVKKLSLTIEDHDKSKYSEAEFEPYRMRFFPTVEETAVWQENISLIKELFENAWKHHYKNNKHHPNYWLDESGNPTDMDIISIVEMLCDWYAMSYHFNQDTIEWYEKYAEKEKSYMTEKTKNIVEEILYNYTH